MAAPTNTTPGTAIDLGILPASITQRVDDSGTCYTVWYKYTTLINDVINIWGYGDVSVYKPDNEVFLGPVTSQQYLNIVANPTSGKLTPPVQFPVRAGETYYFKFVPSNPAASPANLTISALSFGSNPSTLPPETICINDDSGDQPRGDGTSTTFPIAFLSSSADFSPLKFIQDFPSGEVGDCLTNGTSLVGTTDETVFTDLVGFDPNFVEIYRFNFTAADAIQDLRANRTLSKFYVLYVDAVITTQYKIAKLASDGTIEATTSAINATPGVPKSVATSPDGTIAYYCFNATSARIGRWDLVNNIALTDLATGLGNNPFLFNTMLCMADGTVIVGLLTGTGELRRYDPSGTLLHTYTNASLGVPSFAGDPLHGIDCRLSYGIDDTAFWFRGRYVDADGLATGYFLKIKLDDGTVLTRVLNTDYGGGISLSQLTDPTKMPDEKRFGFSNSCTFWIVPTGQTASFMCGVSFPIRRVRRFMA